MRYLLWVEGQVSCSHGSAQTTETRRYHRHFRQVHLRCGRMRIHDSRRLQLRVSQQDGAFRRIRPPHTGSSWRSLIKAKTGLEHPSLAGVKKDIFGGLAPFGGKWESDNLFNSSATYAASDWTAPRLWGSTWSLCTWTWRGSAATSVTVTSGSHPSPRSPLTWKKSTAQNGWPASVHFVGRPTGRIDHTTCFIVSTWYCH